MAGSPFDPGADPNAIIDETLAPIGQQIQSFINDPKGRAALLQFGIQAAQPLAWGQSGGAGLMSSLGAAGEAVGREHALQQKDIETQSKADLAAARADAAGARSGAAADRATTAAQMLELRKNALEQSDKLKTTSQLIALQREYGTRKDSFIKQQAAIANSALATEPDKAAARAAIASYPDFNTWVAKSPVLAARLSLGQPAGDVGGGGGSGALPKVGEVKNGYVYQGGPPGSPSSWQKQTTDTGSED